MHNLLDEQIIRLIAKNNWQFKRASIAIFDRYWGKLLHYFIQKRFSRDDAEELAQDTLQRFIQAVIQKKGECSIGLLWSIARSAAVDRIRFDRAGKRDSGLEVGLDGVAHSLADDGPEVQDGLKECIDGATSSFRNQWPDHFETFYLAVFENWGMKELSEFIGRNYGATRQYVSECRKKYRQILIEQCGDYLEFVHG